MNMFEILRKVEAEFKKGSNLGDVSVSLSAAELAGIGQLTAQMSVHELYPEPHCHAAGKAIFDASKRMLDENAIDLDKVKGGIDGLIPIVEGLGLPDVRVSMKAAGLLSLAGLLIQHESHIRPLGGQTMSAYRKVVAAANEKIREIAGEDKTGERVPDFMPVW